MFVYSNQTPTQSNQPSSLTGYRFLLNPHKFHPIPSIALLSTPTAGPRNSPISSTHTLRHTHPALFPILHSHSPPYLQPFPWKPFRPPSRDKRDKPDRLTARGLHRPQTKDIDKPDRPQPRLIPTRIKVMKPQKGVFLHSSISSRMFGRLFGLVCHKGVGIELNQGMDTGVYGLWNWVGR